MGGKAFSGIGEPIRLRTDRMEPIAHAAAEATGGRVVSWQFDKPDHGDADVVVPASFTRRTPDPETAALVGVATGRDLVFRRPDVRDPILFLGLHMPEGLFQVDLITAPDHLLDFTARYLSWGDLGNFMGRIAREMGMSFGMNGLRLPVDRPGVGQETVLLTADFAEAVDWLGFDVARHDAGFANDVEMVDYVADGRHFDPAVYAPERSTSDARRRGRVRKGRSTVIDDLMSRPARYRWPEIKGDSDLQRAHVAAAIERFGAADAIAAAHERLSIQESRPKSLFSLDAVMDVLKVDEKQARRVASVIGDLFADESGFYSWKLACTPDDVRERTLEAAAKLAERDDDKRRRREAHALQEQRAAANRARRAAEKASSDDDRRIVDDAEAARRDVGQPMRNGIAAKNELSER
jgi:hypothetical protein